MSDKVWNWLSDFSEIRIRRSIGVKPPYRVEQAFLNLEFSIKLYRYFERGLVNKTDFDCATEILTPQGPLQFPSATFHTYEDLVLGSRNAYSTALGVVAIAMDSALADHGISRDPSDSSPRGHLRALVYQMRNAFAHDAMTPVWKVKGVNRKTLYLKAFGIPDAIDLSQLDGQSLELDQIGGFVALQRVREAVSRWVTTGSPSAPEANQTLRRTLQKPCSVRS